MLRPAVLVNSHALQDFAALGPSCTTSTTGTCTLDFSSKANGGSSFDNAVKSALITAPGEGPLVVPQLPASYSNAGNKYSGAIVLDRQLVKPGDDLHVTGDMLLHGHTRLVVAVPSVSGHNRCRRQRCEAASESQLLIAALIVHNQQCCL